MPKLHANLTLKPQDAARFFTAKGDQFAWDYTDVWREANVHAFTVAKATTDDVLGAIRTEIAKAIGPGQTFEEFKRTLRPRLQDLGWWGRKEVLDGDTGELTTAQLGSNRRLRTIYQTNVQTAYMAGRYKRYRANVDDRPYWQYSAIMDGRTRPAHAALHGRIWRWDDPAWSVIWPPCGWGCRCRVIALTAAEFQAAGGVLEDGNDAIIETQVPINRDGDLVSVKGVRFTDAAGKRQVFRPDPGWDYNPGESWSTFDPAGFRGESIGSPAAVPLTPPPPAGTVSAGDGLKTWADAGRPDIRSSAVPRLPSPAPAQPAPSLQAAPQQLLDAVIGTGQTMRVVTTPVGEVALRPELLPAIAAGNEAVAAELQRFAGYVVATLESPWEVWLTPYADGNYRRRFLAVFGDARTAHLMVLRENSDGALMWTVFDLLADDAAALNGARQGSLLFGR